MLVEHAQIKPFPLLSVLFIFPDYCVLFCFFFLFFFTKFLKILHATNKLSRETENKVYINKTT